MNGRYDDRRRCTIIEKRLELDGSMDGDRINILYVVVEKKRKKRERERI